MDKVILTGLNDRAQFENIKMPSFGGRTSDVVVAPHHQGEDCTACLDFAEFWIRFTHLFNALEGAV